MLTYQHITLNGIWCNSFQYTGTKLYSYDFDKLLFRYYISYNGPGLYCHNIILNTIFKELILPIRFLVYFFLAQWPKITGQFGHSNLFHGYGVNFTIFPFWPAYILLYFLVSIIKLCSLAWNQLFFYAKCKFPMRNSIYFSPVCVKNSPSNLYYIFFNYFYFYNVFLACLGRISYLGEQLCLFNW